MLTILTSLLRKTSKINYTLWNVKDSTIEKPFEVGFRKKLGLPKLYKAIKIIQN